jgi:hypothetical protein
MTKQQVLQEQDVTLCSVVGTCRIKSGARFRRVIAAFPAYAFFFFFILLSSFFNAQLPSHPDWPFLPFIVSALFSLLLAFVISYGCASRFFLIAPQIKTAYEFDSGKISVISWKYFDYSILISLIVLATWLTRVKHLW